MLQVTAWLNHLPPIIHPLLSYTILFSHFYCVTFAESEPYCHSILFVWMCVGHYTTYSLSRLIDHNQICPRTRVSLFGSPISHTFGARGKNMQNFALNQVKRTICIALAARRSSVLCQSRDQTTVMSVATRLSEAATVLQKRGEIGRT